MFPSLTHLLPLCWPPFTPLPLRFVLLKWWSFTHEMSFSGLKAAQSSPRGEREAKKYSSCRWFSKIKYKSAFPSFFPPWDFFQGSFDVKRLKSPFKNQRYTPTLHTLPQTHTLPQSIQTLPHPISFHTPHTPTPHTLPHLIHSHTQYTLTPHTQNFETVILLFSIHFCKKARKSCLG